MAATKDVIITRMGRNIAMSEEVPTCGIFIGRCMSSGGGGFNYNMQLYEAMVEADANGHIGVAVTVSRVLFAQQTRGQWEEFSVRHDELSHVEYDDALTNTVVRFQLKNGMRVAVRGGTHAKPQMREVHDFANACIDLTEVYGRSAEELLARINPQELLVAVPQLVRERIAPPPPPAALPLRRATREIEHEAPALPRQPAPRQIVGPEGTGGDVAQQMLKLGEMYSKGLLTNEEFAAMKRRLLNQ